MEKAKKLYYLAQLQDHTAHILSRRDMWRGRARGQWRGRGDGVGRGGSGDAC